MKLSLEKSLRVSVVVIATAVSAFGHQSGTRALRDGSQGPRVDQGSKSKSSVRFTLNRSLATAGEYDLILSDGDERSVSGSFFLDQLYNFRDLLLEAKSFAFTDEAVGKDEPLITRFSNKEERAFAIDVSKRGNQSQFFITIKTMIGQLTVDAGAVNRTEKREEGVFFDILAGVQSQIAKSTGQPIK